MRKILLSLLFVLLSVPAFAQGIYLPVASGTVTQANMKISAVDGTAFVDFSAATVLTGKTGNLLVVRDSSGRAIQGFIKAVGTGETYGSDILSGFNFTTGWSVYNATITGASTFNISASVSEVYKSLFTIGNLYKGTITATATTGVVELYNSATQKYLDANSTGYFTSRTNLSCTVRVRDSSNGASASVAALSAQQVLTPSTTGVTIVSTKGGATFNWAQKNASFNYNDASGYTYQIYKVLDAPVVASGSITAGNALIDATTENAFAAPVGVDLSAYQTGKHLLALYDSSGYAAIGWISATAPSGEALGSNKWTNGDFNLGDTGWTKRETGLSIVDIGGGDYEGVATASTKYADFVQSTLHSIGALHKFGFVCTNYTSGSVRGYTQGNSGNGTNTLTGTGNAYRYFTSTVDISVSGIIMMTDGTTLRVDDAYYQQVTMPAATGALLLSTKGGSRGFLYKHASFNPNAAMTYKVLYVGD